MTQRNVGVVIVAAGSGTRVGGRELKQFRWIAGKPMLLHSVQTFMARPDVAIVVVVLPKSHAADPPPWLFQCDIDRLLVSVGGRERTEIPRFLATTADPDARYDVGAVYIGVNDVRDVDWDEQSFERGHREALALVAARSDRTITATLARDGLWRAQTPQGFPRPLIERAYREARAAKVTATDDAALCERIGLPVVVVMGSALGLKVTEETDFARAEALFAAATA